MLAAMRLMSMTICVLTLCAPANAVELVSTANGSRDSILNSQDVQAYLARTDPSALKRYKQGTFSKDQFSQTIHPAEGMYTMLHEVINSSGWALASYVFVASNAEQMKNYYPILVPLMTQLIGSIGDTKVVADQSGGEWKIQSSNYRVFIQGRAAGYLSFFTRDANMAVVYLVTKNGPKTWKPFFTLIAPRVEDMLTFKPQFLPLGELTPGVQGSDPPQ